MHPNTSSLPQTLLRANMKNYAKLEILVQRELSEIEAYAFFMRLYDLTFTLCIICCILHGTFNVYLYIH